MSIPAHAQGLLADVAAGLSAGSDLHALLVRLLAPLADLAAADAAVVRVLDATAQRMLMVGEIGLPPAVREAESDVAAGCGSCAAALQAERVLWSEDLHACTSHREALFTGAGWRHMLVVPLPRRGRVLGVYNLFFAGDSRPTPQVQVLLKSIGELLGLALDNARLEEEHLAALAARERQAMAADVHDSIAQSLSFVKMRLPLLRDAIVAQEGERALRYCEDVRATVSEAHSGVRRILADAREGSAASDPLGLVHAVHALARRLSERTGIAFEVAGEAGEMPLTPERQTQALHVVQEALTNVVRHADARHVRLAVGLHDGNVELFVDDDGIGMAADADVASGAQGSHYGLEIMKARALRLGGELSFGPRPGGAGTRVRLRFPLQLGGPTAPGTAAAGRA